MDILGKLPPEITELILQLLGPEDLISCFKVSNRWSELVNNDRLWSKHLPYHKYTEKGWLDSVGEHCNEVEGSGLMNRYLTEAGIKDNLIQGKYHVLTTCLYDHYLNDSLDDSEVWVTGYEDGLLLSNGDQLRYKPLASIGVDIFSVKLSSDLKLLAAPYKNFLFIYQRQLPAVEFDLFSLLAVVTGSGGEPDGSTVLSLMTCPQLDHDSITSFVHKYELTVTRVTVNFFTGVSSPNDRRVCLHLSPYYNFPYQFVLWDIDRNRLVQRWNMNRPSSVIEGWDKRGVCIMDWITSRSSVKCVEFYDVNWQLVTVIPVMAFIVDLIVSYNFSVAVITIERDQKLVMWEKDSTEYRVLMNNSGMIVNVGSSTIAYYCHLEFSVTILTAPHWEMLVKVKAGLYDVFSLTEFSDGTLFVITGNNGKYMWYDIDRQNKSGLCKWLIDSGMKFKLPEQSTIRFTKHLMFAIVTETSPRNHDCNIMSFIDYSKLKRAVIQE